MGRFLGVLEHGFRDDVTGRRHHEIDHLFEVRAEGLDPRTAPPSHEPHLEFYWVRADEGALGGCNVLPEPMQTMVPAALANPGPLWVSTME